MPAKPLMLLASSLVTAGLVVAPLAADARGLGQAGTWGKPAGPPVSNLTCGTSLGAMPQMSLPHISSKTSNIYKPVTITSTIDASRNISIIKNIDNSKTIDASKHIEINKSVVIQKIINSNNNNTNNNTNTNNNNSTSDATAQALATAIANLNSTIQVTNNNSSQGGTGGGNITVIATGGNAEGGAGGAGGVGQGGSSDVDVTVTGGNTSIQTGGNSATGTGGAGGNAVATGTGNGTGGNAVATGTGNGAGGAGGNATSTIMNSSSNANQNSVSNAGANSNSAGAGLAGNVGQGQNQTANNQSVNNNINAPNGAYSYYQPGGPSGAYGYSRPVLADGGGTNGQCRQVDTTVIKAIHAICVSADGHQFPASHMIGDTWISSGYEGEIARCLPGSVLKIMVASVRAGDQGMAVSPSDAEIVSCAPGQAIRHFKNGLLKCTVAQKVVDCTERTNLRKWGTGDMFFTYNARICLDLRSEMVGGTSHVGSNYRMSGE